MNPFRPQYIYYINSIPTRPTRKKYTYTNKQNINYIVFYSQANRIK